MARSRAGQTFERCGRILDIAYGRCELWTRVLDSQCNLEMLSLLLCPLRRRRIA